MTARNEDESPNYILQARKIMNIVADPPDNVKTLATLVQNQNFIKKYGEQLLEAIKIGKSAVIEETQSNHKIEPSKIIEHKTPYNTKYLVFINSQSKISLIFHSNMEKPKGLKEKKMSNIQKSLNSVFDSSKALFFNTTNISKPVIKESIKKPDIKGEEIPLSIQEKYQIPMKNKNPSTRKPKQNIQKKQKITEKKDIKIGWLDNVELQPVKRRNLFKKK